MLTLKKQKNMYEFILKLIALTTARQKQMPHAKVQSWRPVQYSQYFTSHFYISHINENLLTSKQCDPFYRYISGHIPIHIQFFMVCIFFLISLWSFEISNDVFGINVFFPFSCHFLNFMVNNSFLQIFFFYKMITTKNYLYLQYFIISCDHKFFLEV